MRITPIDRWIKKHEAEHGHYAVLAGFEEEIRGLDHEGVGSAYDDMDIYDQLALFSWVTDLIMEGRDR